MKAEHLRIIADLDPQDAREVLNLAHDLKARRERGQLSQVLAGNSVALIFHKPSLRTRVSFEVAITQLGGTSLYMSPMALTLGYGLLFATPVTLILVPCLYMIFWDLERVFRRKRA